MARAKVLYATGGHEVSKLYGLKVRTRTAVVNGSLIRVEKGKITDVGSRSAHIAGLPYEIFSDKLENPEMELIAPLKDDEAAFAVVSGKNGRKVSLTLAGAANLLGSVPEGDYAYSQEKENVRVAWQALGDTIGLSAEEAAKQAMDIAAEKIWEIVSRLIEEYKLSPELLCLAGGGGSGGVVVPYLGQKMSGATELKKDSIAAGAVSAEELKAIAAKSMRLPKEEISEVATTGKWHVFEGMIKSKLWGIFPSKKCFMRVLDRNGVVTL